MSRRRFEVVEGGKEEQKLLTEGNKEFERVLEPARPKSCTPGTHRLWANHGAPSDEAHKNCRRREARNGRS